VPFLAEYEDQSTLDFLHFVEQDEEHPEKPQLGVQHA
jgi:hypothetical protein